VENSEARDYAERRLKKLSVRESYAPPISDDYALFGGGREEFSRDNFGFKVTR
jgi:hypothetical protein